MPTTIEAIVWGDLHEYDRAIADFEQASRLKPNDPLVSNNLGNAFAAKDELAKAIANYNRAIEIRRDYAEAYYNRASTYVTLHDELHALADYDEAIRLQPTYGDAYTNRGVLKLIRGEIRQAISDFAPEPARFESLDEPGARASVGQSSTRRCERFFERD
jgi:tetratricopeptide (TPR) repeat protein